MTNARLNKELYTDIQKLKLCSKSDAPVRFLLDKSPFNDDDDDEMANARKPDEDSIVLGRIFPNSDIYNQGAYQIEIKLIKTFPIDPPEVRFNTSIYHPNVLKNGKIYHTYFQPHVSF
jgi:ubiquitin-protein ligase